MSCPLEKWQFIANKDIIEGIVLEKLDEIISISRKLTCLKTFYSLLNIVYVR